jgi:hypothetical protein
MTKSATISYQVGAHRPVYLWAGPGTVRMIQAQIHERPGRWACAYGSAHTRRGRADVLGDRLQLRLLDLRLGFSPRNCAGGLEQNSSRLCEYIRQQACKFSVISKPRIMFAPAATRTKTGMPATQKVDPSITQRTLHGLLVGPGMVGAPARNGAGSSPGWQRRCFLRQPVARGATFSPGRRLAGWSRLLLPELPSCFSAGNQP